MKAEILPNSDPNRVDLVDVLPLTSPYTIVIEPSRLCNFRCFYCLQSTKDDPNGLYSQSKLTSSVMTKDLFNKIAKEVTSMEVQPKRILFQGMGEPMVCKDLPDYVKTLRDYGFVGRVDIVSNASLLTNDVADALAKSGLSKLVISLQGIDSQSFKENCGVDIDFDRFIDNIKYFYERRGETKIYIKIIDSMLKSKADEEKFYKIYGDICDYIFIEHLFANLADMGDIGGKVTDRELSLFGLPIVKRHVCPAMFYKMQIFADGTVLNCAALLVSRELEIGNENDQTFEEIWNGEARKKNLYKMLERTRYSFESCKVCEAVNCTLHPSEVIDSHRETLLERLDKYYEVRNQTSGRTRES